MNEHEIIMTSLRACERRDLFVDPQPLNPAERRRYATIRRRRRAGEPLQYILNRADFLDLVLYVDERVFIPRPETEILVSEALGRAQRRSAGVGSVLECGTGSGNIAVSLARALPQSRVFSVDISSAALRVAARNAYRYDVSDRITFVCQSCSDFMKSVFRRGKKFDMIISNPPYIPRESIVTLPAEVRREPLQALDGGDDGLGLIRDIINRAGGLLSPQGILAFEVGDGQAETVEGLLTSCRLFDDIAVIPDYCRTGRVVLATLR